MKKTQNQNKKRKFLPVEKRILQKNEKKIKNKLHKQLKRDTLPQNGDQFYDKIFKVGSTEIRDYYTPEMTKLLEGHEHQLFDEAIKISKNNKKKRGRNIQEDENQEKDEQPALKRQKLLQNNDNPEIHNKTELTEKSVEKTVKVNKSRDPFQKAKNEYLEKQKEKQRKLQEMEKRKATIEERQQQRKKKSKQLMKRTSKGQPVMANIIKSLVQKL